MKIYNDVSSNMVMWLILGLMYY